jgi:hypothetical protein
MTNQTANSTRLHWEVESTLSEISEDVYLMSIAIPQEGLHMQCAVANPLTYAAVLEEVYRNYRDRVRATLLKEAEKPL